MKITPYASKNEILRWEENRLVIKIQGVPEKRKVNDELIDFLAKTLEITKSRIEILAGRTSRLKKLNIKDISWKEVNERLSKKGL